MYFLEWRYVNFNWYFTEVCFWGSDQQYTTTGPDKGLALTGQQAIIWTNDGKSTDAYMRHLASMSWLVIGDGNPASFYNDSNS